MADEENSEAPKEPVIHMEQRVPLPPELFCDETGKPFTNCIACNCSLDKVPHMVEKVRRRYTGIDTQTTIVEYAICIECGKKMHAKMSEESKARVEQFLMTKADPFKRVIVMNLGHKDDPKGWLQDCPVTKKPISDCMEYAYYGYCEGGELVMSYWPMALSGEALEEMQELLSAKTREELDDFIGTHFGRPPDLRKALLDRPVFVM
jgi:hypothetical protein